MSININFDCTVCLSEQVIPPIIQCPNGHIVCSKCRLFISRCFSCHSLIGQDRNLALEEFAENYKFPCKNIPLGCKEKFHYSKKENHESLCAFGLRYKCPCNKQGSGAGENNCNWTGKLDLILNHIRTNHTEIAVKEETEVTFSATQISTKGSIMWLMVVSCLRSIFIIKLSKEEKTPEEYEYKVIVNLLGSVKNAETISYTILFKNENKSYGWENLTKSIFDEHPSDEMLKFNDNYQRFFTIDDKLSFNITFSKIDEEDENEEV